MEKITLKVTNNNELVNFIKKFIPIENSMLLEFDNSVVKTKSHTPERSVIKYGEIPLESIFETSGIDRPFKVGIYNGSKLQKSLNYFSNSEFFIDIDLDEIDSELYATAISLRNQKLKITLPAASLSIFTYVKDEIMNQLSDTEICKNHFLLLKDEQTKINSLTSLDADEAKVTFEMNSGNILIKNKIFEMKINDDEQVNEVDMEVSILKKHFQFLDNENTKVYLMTDKIVFKSIESETILILGEAS